MTKDKADSRLIIFIQSGTIQRPTKVSCPAAKREDTQRAIHKAARQTILDI